MADASHTLVILDGVPLNDASTGFVDLSTIPIAILKSAKVVRGGLFMGGGIASPGGAVILSSPDPLPGLHLGASLTLGFYPLGPGPGSGDQAGLRLRSASEILEMGAQRKLSLWTSWFGGSLGVVAAGSYESSDGKFAYLDDGGTSYDLSDDAYAVRRNADHASASALLALTWLLDERSRLSLKGSFGGMQDGLPGLDVLQATESALGRTRLQVSMAYEAWRDSLAALPFVMASGFVRLGSMEFKDPLGEIALSPVDSLSRNVLAGIGLDLNAAAPGGWIASWSADLSVEGWRSSDRLSRQAGTVQALRVAAGTGLGLSASLAGGILVLESSLGATLVHDQVGGSGSPGTSVYLSPRAGIKVAPLAWLAITSSIAYSHRPPTFMELFGDGGTFRGNAALEPEEGFTADAGLSLALPEGIAGDLFLQVRATGFSSSVVNLVAFMQNSQRTMVAENVSEARISGVETVLRAGWRGWASVELGYTFLSALDRSGIEPYDGKMLPNRPRHDLFFEACIGHFGVELSYALDWIDGGFVDRARLDPISGRTMHSLHLRWIPVEASWFSIDLAWINIGNDLIDLTRITSGTGSAVSRRTALSDVDGYPLPGTGLFLTLSFRR